MKFTHLHVHSHYSILDGLPKIGDLLDCTKKLGMDSIALTDHGALYGAVEFFKEAQKREIKPIIGAELYVALEKMEDKRPKIDNRNYHITLLVKDEKGYRNLSQMITESHLKGFYYKPRIDEDLLKKHSQGLIALSGCLKGKIPQLILSGKKEQAEKLALSYRDQFGKDSFYLEIQHHPQMEEQNKVNQGLKEISKKTKIPLVATSDSHYLRKEDAQIQDILMCIHTGNQIEDEDRISLKDSLYHLRSPEEMAEIFKDTPEAIENTQKIKDLCQFEFNLKETRLPKFPLPEKETAESYLKKLCYQGIKERYQDEETRKKAKKRVDYELGIINSTGFASYFLIVYDFTTWAKGNRIVVGPGRGSAGGSLVAYVLEITNIDPLKYDLLFERFLNPGRAKVSLPDIDLDFADRRRDEVIYYIGQKYGKDRVAQIITFGTMAARAAIRDVGRVLGYQYGYCDRVAKMVPFGKNLREAMEENVEFRQMYDTDPKARKLIDSAMRLEGVVRHASTHACGIVIGDEPLPRRVPLQHPSQDEEAIVTQYEMNSIESIGLLKMDLLGLKNLTIIEDTLKKIYALYGKSIDLDDIPLDDKKTFKLLQEGKTTGVFQLESGGFQRYLKSLKPSNIEDIVAMVALYRPGPMEFIPRYIKRKHGEEKIEYLHPKLKPILETTYGVCVYQEQVMRIAQEMAGFSLSEADVLRKAIGKKIEELLQSQKEKFLKGIKDGGVEEKVANELWNWIQPFAQYSFNKSHAAAYAQIAYQTAYLKAHYPKEFMSSLLTADQRDIERLSFLMNECEKMEIEVLPPDINESFTYFSVVPDKDQVRFGLAAIKNVGKNLVEEIVEERKEKGKFSSFNDFLTRVSSQSLNKKSLEALAKAGAFEKLIERKMILENMERVLEYGKEKRKNKENGQGGLFDGGDYQEKELKLEEVPPAKKEEKLDWEKELLGIHVSGNPLDPFENNLKKNSMALRKARKKESNSTVRVGGIVEEIKKIITRKGDPMLFLTLKDHDSEEMEIIVFPKIYNQFKSLLEEGEVVFIDGRVSNRDDVPKIICESVKRVEKD